MADDPRTDPVGTVRQNPDGRIAVKTTMGNDNTGSGHHVWCVTDDCIEHRWLHHVEVARWRVLPTPLLDSETEWGWDPDSEFPGDVILAADEAAARERAGAARGRLLMQRRAPGPWTKVQP